MKNENKENFRDLLLNKRKELSDDFVMQKSKVICERLLNLEVVKNSKNIFVYNSHKNEVNTSYFLENVVGKNIYVPKIIDNEIVPCIRENLIVGKFRILEPQESNPINLDEIDLAFIPGVAFDLHGNRIGFGQGFFDRFLSKIDSPTIGLAYEFQIIDKLPTSSYDVPVDMIVTEKRLIIF